MGLSRGIFGPRAAPLLRGRAYGGKGHLRPSPGRLLFGGACGGSKRLREGTGRGMGAEYEVREATAEGGGGIPAPARGVEVAGVVSLWIKPDLAHGDAVVEIPMLAVGEDHRRNGVGKLLISRAREVAAEHEASLVELVATRSNVAARDFYKSQGFVEADVVPLEFVGDVENPPES